MDSISSVGASAPAQTQAVLTLLKQTLELQQQTMAQLLQSMGIGQNFDATA